MPRAPDYGRPLARGCNSFREDARISSLIIFLFSVFFFFTSELRICVILTGRGSSGENDSGGNEGSSHFPSSQPTPQFPSTSTVVNTISIIVTRATITSQPYHHDHYTTTATFTHYRYVPLAITTTGPAIPPLWTSGIRSTSWYSFFSHSHGRKWEGNGRFALLMTLTAAPFLNLCSCIALISLIFLHYSTFPHGCKIYSHANTLTYQKGKVDKRATQRYAERRNCQLNKQSRHWHTS